MNGWMNGWMNEPIMDTLMGSMDGLSGYFLMKKETGWMDRRMDGQKEEQIER